MKRKSFESVYGDCLEKIGIRIPNRGYAVVDRDLKPRVGDVVHCTKISGALSSYIKRVLSVDDGRVTVGTAYIDPAKDFSFEAAEILGVVTEIYDQLFHNLIWERPRRKREN